MVDHWLILADIGQLDEAMELHLEEERLCRELGNIEGLCISTINQGAIFGDKGDRSAQLTLLKQAHAVASQHGYHALANQIMKIMAGIKD